MKKIRLIVHILLVFLVISIPGICNGEEVCSVNLSLLIGLIPEQNIFKQIERYRPLAEYLGDKLGCEVKLTILSKYGDVIDRFNSRGMDGAFFGDLTTVIAYERMGVQPVATVISSDGNTHIESYIVVRNDDIINNVSDMKGKIAAFVDRASVPGYLFPLAYLKKNGINKPEDYFSEVFYTGSYDMSVYAVLDGKADVGYVKSSVLREMTESDKTIMGELKIIATSRRIPNITLCLRKDISPKLRNRLQDILTDISGGQNGKEVLKKFGAKGFKKTSIEDFKPVYELLDEIGVSVADYNYKIE
jgi:phosphonate transport system substrate-binding protein